MFGTGVMQYTDVLVPAVWYRTAASFLATELKRQGYYHGLLTDVMFFFFFVHIRFAAKAQNIILNWRQK